MKKLNLIWITALLLIGLSGLVNAFYVEVDLTDLSTAPVEWSCTNSSGLTYNRYYERADGLGVIFDRGTSDGTDWCGLNMSSYIDGNDDIWTFIIYHDAVPSASSHTYGASATGQGAGDTKYASVHFDAPYQTTQAVYTKAYDGSNGVYTFRQTGFESTYGTGQVMFKITSYGNTTYQYNITGNGASNVYYETYDVSSVMTKFGYLNVDSGQTNQETAEGLGKNITVYDSLVVADTTPVISDVCCTSPDPDDCSEHYETSVTTPSFNGTTDIICEGFISNDNATWVSATTTNSTYHIWTLPEAQALPVGLSSVYAMCNSTSNLKGYDEWEMNITDVTNPNVTIVNPPDNHNISSAPYSITFNATVADNNALANVSLLLNGLYNFTNSTGLINGSYNLPFTFASITDEYNWSIEGCDTSGNCNMSSNRTLFIYLSENGVACSVDADCENSNCVEAINEAVDYCADATDECSGSGIATGYDTSETYDSGVITYLCKGDNLGGATCADAGTQNCDEYADYYCSSGTWVSGSSNELDLGCALCKWCGGTSANSEGDLACENADADTDVGTDCSVSYDACSNAYTRQGADGYCDGAGACDTDDSLLNVSAGNVCYNGADDEPDTTTNCGTWSDCTDGACVASEYWVGYVGDGTSTCVETGWVDTGSNYNPPDNNIISATNKQDTCTITDTGKSASYDACSNPYTRQGPDGYCDGSGSLDTDDSLLNVSAGNVCYNGADQDPDTTTNCGTWSDCTDGACSANEYWVGYVGDGTNTCVDTDWKTSSTTYDVTADYIISATNKQDTCDTLNTGESASYDACSNAYTRQGPDGYCDGSGALDTNDALLNVSAGNVCSSGTDSNPSAGINCGTWSDCTDGEITANEYYVGYTGDGTETCVDTDWQTSGTTWDVTVGYTIDTTEHADVCSEADITLPIINIVYPISATYSENISDLNYTVTEVYTDSCWYSTDNGTTNSTKNAGLNFTGVASVGGNNNWTVYCNDTAGNIGNNNVTFYINPLWFNSGYSYSNKSFRITEFVKVNGTDFTLAEQTYHSIGANFYYAIDYMTNLTYSDNGELISNSADDVYEVLNEMKSLGVNVVRTWAGTQGGNENGTNATWTVNLTGGHYNLAEMNYPGNYNETYFKAMDKFIYECSKRDIRPQLVLVNNWEAYGGMQWYLSHSSTSDKTYEDANYLSDNWWTWHDQFYNDAEANTYFKNFINYTLNRNNTYSGIVYKEDPTIFSWFIANEPRAKTVDHSIIADWCNDTSYYIKSIDSNHLVSCGIEGLGFTESWGEGSDIISVYNNTGSDYVTFAMNTGQWGYMVERVEGAVDDSYFCDVSSSNCGIGNDNVRDFWASGDNYTYNVKWHSGVPYWIPQKPRHTYNNWVEQNVEWANELGKPVMLQEMVVDQSYSDVTKDDLYENAIHNFYSTGGDGMMFWTMNSDSYYRDSDTSSTGNQDDGYGFYVSNNATLKARSASTISAFNFTKYDNSGGSWVTSLNNYKYDFVLNVDTANDISIINCSIYFNVSNGTWTDNYIDQTNTTEVIQNTDYTFTKQFNSNDIEFYWYTECIANDTSTITSSVTYALLQSNLPIISLETPENNSFYNTNPTTLNYNVTNTSEIAYCDLYVNGVFNQKDSTVSLDITQSFSVATPEGVYNWSITCTDIEDNIGSSETWNFTIDTTDPVITWNNPSAVQTYSNQNLSINITSSDSNLYQFFYNISNSSGVTIYSDFYDEINDTTFNLTEIYNFTYEDNYSIFVEVIDGTGTAGSLNNVNETYYYMFDITSPNATLLTPLNNSYVSNTTQNFTTNLTDDISLDNVTLYIYNSSDDLINETTISLGSVTEKVWGIVVNLWDGFFKWFVRLVDTSGNTYATENFTVTIDTVNPYGVHVSPANNSISNNLTVTFQINENDTIDLSNVTFFVYSSNNSEAFNIINVSGTFNETNWTFTLPYDDTFKWSALIYDTAGNSNWTDEVNWTLTVDTTYPTIDYDTLTEDNNTNLSQTYIEMNVSYTETNFANVTWNINGTEYVNTSKYYEYNETGLSDGNYYYNVTVCDSANNCNSTETRLIVLDATYPQLTIISPTAQTYTTSSIDFNISSNEALGYCKFTIDDWATNTTMTSLNTTYYYNTSTVSDGSYTAKFWCNDSAGNINDTEQVSFSVDTTAPWINFTSPTPDNDSYINTNYTIINVSVNENVSSCILSWDPPLTGYVDPNEDVGTMQWGIWPAEDTHTSKIDDAVRQPDAPEEVQYDYIGGEGASQIDVFDMSTLTNVDSISEIKIWAYGRGTTWNGDVTASIYVNSGWEDPVSFSLTNSNSWKSATFSGTWTQADLDALQIKLTSTYGGMDVSNWILEMYAEITYTEAGKTITNYTMEVHNNDENTWANYTVTDLEEDINYTYWVICNDTIGNENQTINYTLAIDLTYPTIDWDTLTEANYTNKSQTYIEMNVSYIETNFANVTWNINGTERVNTTAYYKYNETGLGDGNYYYNVTICDLANNCNSTETRLIVLDTTDPNATLLTPLNNSYVNNQTQNYTANITDNSGVKNYTIYVYNSSDELVNETTVEQTAGITEQVVGFLITLKDGIHKWFISLWDWAGNIDSTENFTVTIDATNPTLDFGTGTEDNNTYFPYDWIFSNVSYTETNFANITWNINGTEHTNISEFYEYNETSLSDGNYSYNITVCDLANNCNSTETLNIVLDITYPQINWSTLTEENNTNLSQDFIEFNVTWTELYFANISYDIDGSPYSYYDSDTTETWLFNKTNIDGDGTYEYNVTLCDLAGNCNTTETRTITLDTTDPNITITSPTNNSVLTSTSITLTSNATDTFNMNCTAYLGGSLIYNISNNDSFSVINTTTGTDGSSYFYNVTCTDLVGNSVSSYHSFSIAIPLEGEEGGTSGGTGTSSDSLDSSGYLMCGAQITQFQKCFHYNGTHCISGCLSGYYCSDELKCVGLVCQEDFVVKGSSCVPERFESKVDPIITKYYDVTDKYFNGIVWAIPVIIVLLLTFAYVYYINRKKKISYN